MRKVILMILVVGGAVSLGISQKHWGDGVKGAGPVVKETRAISGFTKVASGIAANVFVRQASAFQVEVEGQKNVLGLLITEVVDGVLKIRFEENVSYDKALSIYISAPSFEELKLSGSGDLKAENGLSGTSLKLTLSGSGNVNISDAQYTNVNCHLSGSGDVVVGGKATNAEYHISGSGSVDSGNLEAQNVTSSVSGSGDLTCKASVALNAKVSGSGNIRYSGNPSVISKVSGSGEISAR